MFQGRACGLSCLLTLLLMGIPAVAWCTSGEVLLRELREQVDAQRQKMSPEELEGTGDAIGRNPADPGNVVECTPEAIAAFRINGGEQLLRDKRGTYIYNATYTRVTIPIGTKYCVYLTQPIARGLTVEEARDLYVADHLEFPRYDPPASDLQIGEDQFLSLRSKARSKRTLMTDEQRNAIEVIVDRLVGCTEQELSENGVWRETVDENDEIGAENFVWGWSHSSDGDPCIFVRSPLHRALNVDEARDLLTVSSRPLPSMEHALPISPAGAKRKADTQTNSHPVLEDEKKNELATLTSSDPRIQILNNPGYPEDTIALVAYTDSSGTSRFGTAVQVSSYVFMTAAHVLVDENTGVAHTNITIAPRNGLPSTVTGIPIFSANDCSSSSNCTCFSTANCAIDPDYTKYSASDPTQNIYKYAHDIGFIRLNIATPGDTIKPHPINSATDVGLNGHFDCPLGKSQYDPLYLAGATADPKTWFNGTFPSLSPDQLEGCSSTIVKALTYTVGYPVYVRGTPNLAHYAYLDKSAKFYGYGSQAAGQLYVLYHPDIPNTSPAQSCANCKPFEGLKSWITPGDSGGPVFGVDTAVTPVKWQLLGIIGSSTCTDPNVTPTSVCSVQAAFDDLSWNDYWIQQQINWTPDPNSTPPVVISSPTEGASYDLNSVPDLKANAGTQTSKIQWTSNLDGALGTGGDVPISGKLSPGDQFITATLPPSTTTTVVNGKAVTTSTGTVVTTLHITITGIAKPQISASPAQVVVEYGSASAPTTIAWTVATGSTATTVAYIKNGGALTVWQNNVAASSAAFTMQPGDSVTFYAYQPQYDYTKGNQVTVTGVAGAKPSISATPNPVPIVTALGSATYTLTWNAPGYGQISVYERQNIQNAGKIVCIGDANESGSAPEGMTTGEVATLWLLPYVACTPGTIVSALPQAALASVVLTTVTAPPPTLSASANPVVIPYGQPSQNYTLSWSAPGYGQVTVYGQQNLQNAGQILCLGSAPETDSAQEAMARGEIATLWLLPYTGCTSGAVVSALPAAALATLNLTTVNGAAPTLAASPNPVLIPTGQSSANYTLSWGAQGYTFVSLYGRQNLQNPGQIVCLGTGGASGSAQEGMTIGETATLWMLPYTACVPGSIVSTLPAIPLAPAVTVTTVTQSPSTLTATPNPVVIPVGQTSANYTLSWNAPGFSQVSVYGQQNIQNAGQILCLGSAGGSGSAPEGMTMGEVATVWLLPYTGCTPGAVVSAVPLGVLATLNITASN